MKITVLSENLQKKLSFLNHAVSSKNQLPILLNFLLQAKGNTLTISATDLEIAIIQEIPVTVDEEGSIAVSARLISEIITTLPAQQITLETQGKNLVLKSKKTKTIFQTQDAVEFPTLYKEKGIHVGTFDKETVEKNFIKVVFAASAETARPALSGVMMQKSTTEKGGEFLLVATDGYRLSLQRIAAEKNTQEEQGKTSIIVPARLLKELQGLPQEKIEMFVTKENNQVLFFQKETTLVGRLIEAQFPQYEKIIPSEFATRAIFDKEELYKAVKTSAIFARESANIVKFAVEKDRIVVSANAPSVGENTVEVEAKVSGEENEIAFNSRYLLDLFANIDEEQMIFEMTGPLNPGVFKIADDPSFLHIIMPIRVQG